mmetsp:Transcript_11619/g.32649  ORF Transcript_11619/g.32649 Transcript_11619/m.32649 type:complete len:344 (-) Transcript_11619:1231-2262(-)
MGHRATKTRCGDPSTSTTFVMVLGAHEWFMNLAMLPELVASTTNSSPTANRYRSFFWPMYSCSLRLAMRCRMRSPRYSMRNSPWSISCRANSPHPWMADLPKEIFPPSSLVHSSILSAIVIVFFMGSLGSSAAFASASPATFSSTFSAVTSAFSAAASAFSAATSAFSAAASAFPTAASASSAETPPALSVLGAGASPPEAAIGTPAPASDAEIASAWLPTSAPALASVAAPRGAASAAGPPPIAPPGPGPSARAVGCPPPSAGSVGLGSAGPASRTTATLKEMSALMGRPCWVGISRPMAMSQSPSPRPGVPSSCRILRDVFHFLAFSLPQNRSKAMGVICS